MKQQDFGLNLSKRRTRKTEFLDQIELLLAARVACFGDCGGTAERDRAPSIYARNYALHFMLKDVLARLPTHKNSRIEELLPHNWPPLIR